MSDTAPTQSPYLDSLLTSLRLAKQRRLSKSAEPIEVSDTVSFFAMMYERVRNSVEFTEEHLIRRMAITRILKRRLSIKPKGDGEGENLIRELLWGHYIKGENGTNLQVNIAQSIIDKFLTLQERLFHEGQIKTRHSMSEFIIQLMSCEIEEALHPVEAERKSAYLFFLYQELKNRVGIEGIDPNLKDTFFYAACEAGYAKNDAIFIRYHLFTLQYGRLTESTDAEFAQISANFKNIFHHIENIIKNPYHEKLVRYVKKQLPPFLILYQIIDKKEVAVSELFLDQDKLKTAVQDECSIQYQSTGEKLKAAGIRSIIYIFLTKMIFVLILELPLTRYIYGEIHLIPIAVNSLFPPAFMAMIVTFVSPPSNKNTGKIFNRILDIVEYDRVKDDTVTHLIGKKNKIKRPIMYAIFTILSTVLFWLIFTGIFLALDLLEFNLISKGIFIFFLTVVTFFGYRIRQIAKEYAMETTRNILSPIIEVFFLPILSVGKLFSSQLSKINLFIFIFDVIIETPLKLILEVFEEWFKFTRKQKDEII